MTDQDSNTQSISRPLYEVASEIRSDWRQQRLYIPSAAPYLQALDSLQDLGQHYGADSSVQIVTYLLCNLHTWKGETARRIKAELNSMLKAHQRGQKGIR